MEETCQSNKLDWSSLVIIIFQCAIFSPLSVKPEYEDKISSLLAEYSRSKTENRLLSIEFQTLSEYLMYLQTCATALRDMGPNAMLYLAAAVSDFYIPKEQMVINVWS